MAQPDRNYVSKNPSIEWSIQLDYTYADNDSSFRCALTGQPRRPGEIIYRGGHVDDFYGFYSIGQDAAEQLARLAGFVDPDELMMTPDEALLVENENLKEELAEARAKLAEINDALTAARTV